jgi:hypothetical protein
MRKIICLIYFLILVIFIIGCNSDVDRTGQAKTPSGSKNQEGKMYQEVIDEFEKKGFTNIQTETIEDLIIGWLTKDGEVENVSVDGDVEYSPDVWYPNDVLVVVKYHTFPNKDENVVNEEKNSEDNNDITSNKDLELSEEIKVDVLTIETNNDLVKLLAIKEPNDTFVGEFVEKYKGRVIQFDGFVASIMKHDKYKTRYDILIYVGEDIDSPLFGPNFKFEDIGISELNYSKDNVPETILEGQKLKIIAEVREYKETSELFILYPITTEFR